MRYALLCMLFLATPVLAQEREWQLDVADEDVFLVFGVPETDDVGVSFWCKINSNVLRIYVPEGSSKLLPDKTTTVTLSINNQDYALDGKTSENQTSGRTSVEMETPLNHPAVTALQTADHFSLTIADHKTVTPLLDTEIANLLKLCGQAPKP